MGTSVFDKAWGADAPTAKSDTLDALWGGSTVPAHDTPGKIDLRQPSDTTKAGKPVARPLAPAHSSTDDTDNSRSGALGTIQHLAEGIVSGLPFADRAVAGYRGIGSLLSGHSVDEATDEINSSLQNQRNHVAALPKAGRLGLQLVGGAPAATIAAPLGVLGGGAAFGAAQGLNEDAPTITGHLINAAEGGGIGAATAGLTHGIGKGILAGAVKSGAAQGVANLVSKVSPEAGATMSDWVTNAADQQKNKGVYDLLRKRIAASGKTASGVQQEIADNTAASGEKPEVLGDYVPGVARLTKTLTKRPDAAQSMILPVLEDRAQQTRGRVLQDLTQGGNVAASDPAAAAAPDLPNTAPPTPQRPARPVSPAPGVRDRIATTIQDLTGAGQNDVRQAAEHAVQARANTASELFPQAHASDDVLDTPASQEMLQRPIMQKLFGRAQEAAANRGETLPMATERRLNSTAQTLLSQAKPQDAPALEQRLLAIPGFSEEVQRPVLNGRSMHYMDIALRQSENGFESENGITRSSAADARQILNQLRPMRDAALPALAEAQNTYADQSGPIHAYDQGLNFLKTLTSAKAPDGAIGRGDPVALKSFRTGIDGLEQAVQHMAPEDVPRFRQAAQQALLEQVRNTPASANGSTAGVLRGVLADTPLAQRAQRILFDSPEQLAQFQEAVNAEHTGLANYRQAAAEYPGQMDQHRTALQRVRQEAQLIRQSNKGNIPAQETLASRMPQGDATLRRLRMGDQVTSVNSVPATETGSTIPVLRRAFPDSPVDESRVRQLFPSQETADRFMHALNRERNMAATTGLMRGSDTFENAAAQADLTPKSVVGMLHRPSTVLGKGLDWLQDRAVTRQGEHLAPLVTARTPGELTEILSRLSRPDQYDALNQFWARDLAGYANAQGGK